MNETIKSILNRRSYRAYKPEQISKEELDAIINCGLNAPSAMNTQNWHFTVIQNKDLLARINADTISQLPKDAQERMTARNGGSKDFSLFYFAPTVVLVSGVADDRYSLLNGAYAAENMCVAAESMNIGSIIIGMAAMLFNSPKAEDYMRELRIPSGYKPDYAVCFGYKGMEAAPPEREKDRVTYFI